MSSMIPAQKYHGEQSDRYGGQVHWPGANGFPFRGDAAPTLKQSEVEALPVIGDAHNHVFDLNDETDREYYQWVRDRMRNGVFVRDFIERRWPEDRKYPVIYMEWTQCYVFSPKQSQQDAISNSRNFTLSRDSG